MRRCLYLIRTRKLHELCRQADKKLNTRNGVNVDTIDALDYLRTFVTPLVNGDSKEELDHFKQLCAHLCLSQDTTTTKKDYITKNSQGLCVLLHILFIFCKTIMY